jgi:hypothetical protein
MLVCNFSMVMEVGIRIERKNVIRTEFFMEHHISLCSILFLVSPLK